MSFRYLKQKFRDAPAAAFESLVAAVWREYGYTVDESPESTATGLDLLASRSRPYSRREAVCVAHRSEGELVESAKVQQVSALRRQADADDVVLVTNAGFTDDAVTLAGELDVHVVDGDSLFDTVHSADLYATVADVVSVDVSVDQSLRLEALAERVVMNTDLESLQAVYDMLYEFFAEHSSAPRIEENATVSAFLEDAPEDEWEQSTSVSWSVNPDLDSRDIAEYLVAELPAVETRSVELSVVAAAIQLELDERLGEYPSEMTAEELAAWCVEAFDEQEVPVAATDPGMAIDTAVGVVDTTESAAVNKLRVASALNRQYEDEYVE
ncbi:restriction endonuclease [Haloarcula onubensis]|uniref:Restriction endonuclease n=1 Tax=Haloarcula onubensis TaxID=2950539 RepID=A0ABU2FTF7_9EURY|nr:restriction endonuclease [Halomicroarcula sp. S3CR25-11]MDS0284049.1 restriction endonuclease [Halomicroarcula sp. S3CR25-11]